MSDVLLLVTGQNTTVYRQHVSALERLGIDSDTVAVPDTNSRRRTLQQYLRFSGAALRQSLSDYAVVHATDGLAGLVALAQRRRPVVLSLWGSDLLGRHSHFSTWCANRCDEVIVTSEHAATEVDRETHIIPSGVDMGTFRPSSRERARTALDWEQDARIVLLPYNPTRPISEYGRALSVANGAADRLDANVAVQTISETAPEAVARHMNAADLLLMTARQAGAPNTARAALACNCPVVSTAISEVRHYVRDLEYSGVCHNDEQLMTRVASVLRDTPVAEGREQVTALEPTAMAQDIISVYQAAGATRLTVDS